MPHRAKTILCRCEDVTLDDLLHALDLGYLRMEEVKRYTGLGTGPCEGKECMAACARLLAEHARLTPDDAPLPVEPFTARSPLAPVSFAALAVPDEAPAPADGEPHAPRGDRAAHG